MLEVSGGAISPILLVGSLVIAMLIAFVLLVRKRADEAPRADTVKSVPLAAATPALRSHALASTSSSGRPRLVTASTEPPHVVASSVAVTASAADGSKTTANVSVAINKPNLAPSGSIAANASPGSRSKITVDATKLPVRLGPDRIGDGDLWMWRREAVRRLVNRHLDIEWIPLAAAKTQRRIWELLDDRPNVVVVGSSDGQARLLDVRGSYKQLISVRHDPGARQAITSTYLAPGPTLLTGTWDGKIHEWESWPRAPKRAEELARGEAGVGHENVVVGFAVSRDGRTLAVACTAGRVLIFKGECPVKEVSVTDREDLVTLKNTLKMGDHDELYLKEDLELPGTERLLARDELLSEASFAGKKSKREVDQLDLPAVLRFRFVGCITRGHKKSWRRFEHNGAVKCIALSAIGPEEFLYSGGRDRVVKKWSLSSGCLTHCYEGHAGSVLCLTVNEKFLATGSDDRTLRVWKREEPILLRTLNGHRDFVVAAALCPNLSRRLVSASLDEVVTLWDASTGERLLNFPQNGAVVALLLNSSLMISACADTRLRVWHVESATLEREVALPSVVTSLAWR